MRTVASSAALRVAEFGTQDNFVIVHANVGNCGGNYGGSGG